MITESVTPDILIPSGRLLLGASFGFCLVRSMRGSFDLHLSFERMAIGCIALIFFKSAASQLLILSEGLSTVISRLGHQEDLRAIILNAFQKASGEPGPSGTSTSFNLPAVLEQAWRTGVWGVMCAVVDWVFLIASFLLESARDVFWTLLLFLFPIACGVYPVAPQMFNHMSLYAIELALWFPMLSAVEVTTALVARKEMLKAGSWGLYVVAVELLAIILILMIPAMTHKFLSGAFSGDLDSQASLFRSVRRILNFKKGPVQAE